MIDRKLLKRLIMPARRVRGRLAMSVGRISSANPLCRGFGYSRGTPIDRYYIERFLQAHSADIRGRVLEIGDDSYSRRFGGGNVTKQDVLHVRGDEPKATIVGDLAEPRVLPKATFDCIILTQTLHLIFDAGAALKQVHDALRPGGVALITVPGVSSIDRGEWHQSWYWSFTGAALERLLTQIFRPDSIEVSTNGNLFAATAFLHGAVVEEVSRGKLDRVDTSYPVTVAARAVAKGDD
jgi:SAM-dependent methyltransferase